MIARAAAGDAAYAVDLAALRAKHVDTAAELLGGPGAAEYDAFAARLDADAADLLAVLRAIKIAGGATDMLADFVVGHGELWCAALWAAFLRTAGADAEALGLQIPQGAVDGVTGCASWQQALQSLPLQPRLQRHP